MKHQFSALKEKDCALPSIYNFSALCSSVIREMIRSEVLRSEVEKIYALIWERTNQFLEQRSGKCPKKDEVQKLTERAYKSFLALADERHYLYPVVLTRAYKGLPEGTKVYLRGFDKLDAYKFALRRKYAQVQVSNSNDCLSIPLDCFDVYEIGEAEEKR